MRLLIVDDEENIRKGLGTFLSLRGHEADAVSDLTAAREALVGGRDGLPYSDRPYGAVLLDVYVGMENGASLLDFAEERGIATPIIMMSGQGTVKDAVATLRKGAYDFLEKPIDTDRLLAALRNLERESETISRLEAFRGDWLSEHLYVEPGSPMAAVVEEARRVAASPLSVMVTGPTGSGKELVARWIHICSPRSRGPFVAVNCAAIPPELAESAFFGSRKGSFTGASADRQGYFAAAAGGTLFLDEVGEIPLGLQAKLLRAAESGEIQPVGASLSEKTDARIVAATNRDLEAEIASRRFREDLFWRLAQTRIRLPALSERRAEIRGLASFLARSVRTQIGERAPSFGAEGLAWIEAREWPGNARELRGFIEKALWLAPAGAELGAADLARLDGQAETGAGADTGTGAGTGAGAGTSATKDASPAKDEGGAGLENAGGSIRGRASGGAEARTEGEPPSAPRILALLGLPGSASLAEAKEGFERRFVRASLDEAEGSVAKAAEKLGLLPNNLSRKLRELGLR